MDHRRSSLRRHRRKQAVHDSAPAGPALFGRHEPASLFFSSCDYPENQFSQEAASHEGVLICATCERAPAVVTCIADAAALCAVCDAEIHSASSLARRHHRIPILTFPPPGGTEIRTEKACTNPLMNDAEDAFFPSEEVNQYLNLTELDDLDAELQPMGSERVVPLSRAMAEEHQQLQQQKHHLDASAFPLFGYSAPINNSVPVSSMKAITVPDAAAAAMSGLPVSFHQPHIPLPQFSSFDREARVLRYKEKKKARNFEKTIRYASRKAYAEARPRIRGRFARRSDVEADAGKKLSGSATSEDGYGIVPSFP